MSAIALERRGPAAWVWLDRPELRNAFDAAMIGELTGAFDALARDDSVRCVVLAGRGEVFSAGADVRWMQASLELSHAENVADAERLAAMLAAVDGCPKPVVGRVHGHALGGGTGLVACCDVAIAAARATFAFSEARLGLIPATIAPFALERIGLANARALFLTGRRFDAAEALRLGLVHAVVDDEAALDAAVEAAVADVLACGPEALEHAKRLLFELAGHDPVKLRRLTAEAIAGRRTSHEAQEGLRAFVERRRPSWADRE